MNKKLILTVISIIVIISILFAFSACKARKELHINEIVSEIFSENNIEKSKIYKQANYEDNDFVGIYDAKYNEISDQELEKHIEDVLLLHEKMIEVIDRKIVQKGDAIVVSYVVRYDNKIVANTNNDSLMVGSGNYGKEFEDAVIGAVVGEPFECELHSPIDTAEYKKGDVLHYNITVESINYFETYTSSDRYILDYYGVETEEEFLSLCEIRLKQIKQYQNKQSADNEFLDKIAEKCRFSVNKQEAAKYSEKVVEHHENLAYISGLELNEYIENSLKMTEEEFYDFCYDEGVKEIKRYLLVGAHTSGFEWNGELYAEFCSMNGYDSTNEDDLQAKYDYLKSNTVIDFRNLVSGAVLYNINYDNGTQYTVDVCDSSNVYTIDFSKTPSYNVDKETQDAILSSVMHTGFGGSVYGNVNHLYQTVLVVKGDGKICAKIMIDEVNGFVKWQTNDGKIVLAELDEKLFELITAVKQKNT